MRTKQQRYAFRKVRVHRRIKRAREERPRLSVYRSLKHIYAQVIDDQAGKTLAFASSLSKELRRSGQSGVAVAAAKTVGELVAKRALEAGVKKVAFDRGGRMYHGRIQALADAARKAGLEF